MGKNGKDEGGKLGDIVYGVQIGWILRGQSTNTQNYFCGIKIIVE